MAGLMLKYFVLKPGGSDIYAKASRNAMVTYAAQIFRENPEFSAEIIDWVNEEETKGYEQEDQMIACACCEERAVVFSANRGKWVCKEHEIRS
jgi:hypothetical protein